MPSERIPLIGVTGPGRDYRLSWGCLWSMLRLEQARMLRLRPQEDHFGAAIDGLIVSGGRDVDPQRWGQERRPRGHYDFRRDEMELRWLDWALKRGIPVLGICRGAQLINVHLGGSLYQDIRLVCETARHPDTIWSKVFFRKPVAIMPDTRLATILEAEALMVNSLHRQSVDRLGAGLMVAAQEENLIVQAIENIDIKQWLVGVQWHPEFMIESAGQRRIFNHFLRAVRARMASSQDSAPL